MRAMKVIVAAGLAVAVWASAAPAGQGETNWPEFRGPRADGSTPSDKLPLTWSESENVVWKTPIAGKGWSSPVIWGKQIWMTTATPGRQDDVRRLRRRRQREDHAQRQTFRERQARALQRTQQLRLAHAVRRGRTRLRALRHVRHGLPGHRHRQDDLAAAGPALRPRPGARLFARAVRRQAVPDFRRHGRAVRHRAGRRRPARPPGRPTAT